MLLKIKIRHSFKMVDKYAVSVKGIQVAPVTCLLAKFIEAAFLFCHQYLTQIRYYLRGVLIRVSDGVLCSEGTHEFHVVTAMVVGV
jgi:hypothetical protein